MERARLKDLVISITDGEHGSVSDVPNTNYFLLSNKNILDGNIVITSEDRTIEKKTFDKIRRRTRLEKGDLLLSTVGTIGKTAIVKHDHPNYDFQRSVGIIKCDTTKMLPEYLMYYLNLSYVQDRLQLLSKGAIQKCLYINDLEELIIDYPEDISEQQKLIESLVNIDRKIKINSAMVQKLQEMILTRYSVDFEHIGMVNGKLKDICKLPSGFSFKPGMYVDDGIYKLITIKNVSDTFVDTTKVDKLNAVPIGMKDFCKLCSGDILMSLTGNVGRISIVVEDNNLLNQRVSLLDCNDDYKTYLYALLHSKKYQIIMNKLARGTSQKNLSPLDVENINIYIPNDISDFNSNTFPSFKEMINIQKQTTLLTQLKDTLLPLLINGQLI